MEGITGVYTFDDTAKLDYATFSCITSNNKRTNIYCICLICGSKFIFLSHYLIFSITLVDKDFVIGTILIGSYVTLCSESKYGIRIYLSPTIVL